MGQKGPALCMIVIPRLSPGCVVLFLVTMTLTLTSHSQSTMEGGLYVMLINMCVKFQSDWAIIW